MTSSPPDAEGQPHEYAIVGAGPAGLQMAYFLQRAGLDYVTLEAEQAGHFFSTMPRHRRLISNNKVYTGFTDPDKNLRWDWNSLLSEDLSKVFTTYTDEYFPSADVLVEYLQDYARHFNLNILENARVSSVSRDDSGIFELRLQDGQLIRALRVIIAAGHNVPHSPDVPGVELCEQYAEVHTDPREYTNQRVMIVGKGNSGLETAENLFATAASLHVLSPNPIRIAWNTHHVSDVRAVYNNTLDSYQLKMQNTIIDANLTRIEKLDDGRLKVTFKYSHAQGQTWELTVDRVILCCGFRFDFSILDDSCACSTCHGGRWPAMTSSWESVDVPGLYFAGTLMQARDYKTSFSGFIHGFRYNIKFLSELLQERYHGRPRKAEPIGTGAGELTAAIIDRGNNASSIFQLPALLTDVYLLDEPDGRIVRYRDTTKDYTLENQDWAERSMLLVSMEYGHLPAGADPFNFPRAPLDGNESQFIHPVLRLYRRGELIETYHVPEDLENEWDKPMYTGPCEKALERMIDGSESHGGREPVSAAD